jgi:aminopeptidase-like protein
MSLTYNFNKTLYKADKSMIHPASSIIAMFYLSNANAKENEIKDFAEKNALKFEEVKKINNKFRYKCIFLKGEMKIKFIQIY